MANSSSGSNSNEPTNVKVIKDSGETKDFQDQALILLRSINETLLRLETQARCSNENLKSIDQSLKRQALGV